MYALKYITEIEIERAAYNLAAGEVLGLKVSELITFAEGCQPSGSRCLITAEEVETIDNANSKYATIWQQVCDVLDDHHTLVLYSVAWEDHKGVVMHEGLIEDGADEALARLHKKGTADAIINDGDHERCFANPVNIILVEGAAS